MNQSVTNNSCSPNAAWRVVRSLCCAAIIALGVMTPSVVNATRNGNANGDWISMGIPTRINVGSTGLFYMSGNDHGTCGSTATTYLRSDPSKPYFKEFYAMIVLAQANQRPLECIVESGCGTSEIWVTYCTLAF